MNLEARALERQETRASSSDLFARMWARAYGRRFLILSVASVLGVLALWELLPEAGVVSQNTIPAPSTIVSTLGNMLHPSSKVDLIGNTGYTLGRFVGGLFIFGGIGLVLGLVIGIVSPLRVIFQPLISVFYPLPTVVLFPLILIWLGQNEQSMLVMIGIGPFFVMLISTITAVTSVDRQHLEVARAYGARWPAVYRRVIAPAALPVILGGARLAVGAAMTGVIVVEMLIATQGLGHVLWTSWQELAMKQAFAVVVAAAVISMVFYSLTALLEYLLVRWR